MSPSELSADGGAGWREPNPPDTRPLAIPAVGVNPYRGYAAYREADAALFFGRNRPVADAVSRIEALARTGGMLAIVGESGAGKTSLLNAGVVPEIRRRSPERTVMRFSLGSDPIGALTRELAADRIAAHAIGPPSTDGGAAGSLPEASRVGPGQDAASPRPVVIVDQFEQLYTESLDAAARRVFLAALRALALPGPDSEHAAAIVVLVVRSDYWYAVAAEQALDLASRNVLVVRPMSEAEAREAIAGPARAAGLAIEPAFTTGLLDDLGAQIPGARFSLPLLSLVMHEAFLGASGRMLTLFAYHRSRGVAGTLARIAESLYSSMGPMEQSAANFVLLWLVDCTSGQRPALRWATRGELATSTANPAETARALAQLIEFRLVVADAEGVALAHGALLDSWPRLATLVDAHRADLSARVRTEAGAAAWLDQGRDPDRLLAGQSLVTVLVGLDGVAPPSARAREYLDASLDRQLAVQRRASQARSVRRSVIVAAVLVVCAVIAVFVYPGVVHMAISQDEAVQWAGRVGFGAAITGLIGELALGGARGSDNVEVTVTAQDVEAFRRLAARFAEQVEPVGCPPPGESGTRRAARGQTDFDLGLRPRPKPDGDGPDGPDGPDTQTTAQEPADPRLLADFPARAPLGAEISLIVRIRSGQVRDHATRAAALKPFDIPPHGRRITVVVQSAAGLVPLDVVESGLLVRSDGSSEPARFPYRVTAVGLLWVSVTAWSGGTFLGELELEVSAERDGPLRDAPTRAAPVAPLAPVPGEVTMQVRMLEGRYFFQLLSDSSPGEPVLMESLAGDPGRAVESMAGAMREMALGRSRYAGRAAHAWLRESGANLWDQMVPHLIKEQFWELSDRIGAFSIAADHDLVPWELLYPLSRRRDAGFLVEQFPVTRRVFGQGHAKRLSLASPGYVMPTDSPTAASEEIAAVRRALGANAEAGSVFGGLEALLEALDSGSWACCTSPATTPSTPTATDR